MADELPELCLPDATAWRAWLAEHHDQPQGVWLLLAKKGTTEPTSLRYDQALDEALCFGWIDGQVRGGSDGIYRQRWTPRRARSPWSRRNVDHATRLTRQGVMQPSGLREIERAKADGRWESAYAGPAAIEVPADLAAALALRPRAQAMFETLTSQNRYAVLLRLTRAKRPETRARRLRQYVEMLARGETIYPQRRRPPDA
ncbi:MAG TPA: YdeI/OmpD-associated family protein [Actinomycetales bacterium]|nr:YdeI/OmpD-associated family protein [Actinomycetales bacterium]